MRICVTNDDGVGTTGITTLARALRDDGHDVLVVAPKDERSGAGTALGRVVGGDVVSWHRTDADGVEVFALDAPPAMCVLAAMEGIAGARPDLVVSGINHGPNLGFAVLHSGTVGAALTAHIAGIPALAVSVGQPATGVHGVASSADDPIWDAAAALAVALVGLADEWSGQWVPNVNVPSAWDGGPVRCCRLARLGAIGLAVNGDDSAVVQLRSHAELDEPEAAVDGWPDDLALNAAGHATMTPLTGVAMRSVETDAIEALLSRLRGSIGSAAPAGYRPR